LNNFLYKLSSRNPERPVEANLQDLIYGTANGLVQSGAEHMTTKKRMIGDDKSRRRRNAQVAKEHAEGRRSCKAQRKLAETRRQASKCRAKTAATSGRKAQGAIDEDGSGEYHLYGDAGPRLECFSD